jgi:predicted PurR-regulated permease PerM
MPRNPRNRGVADDRKVVDRTVAAFPTPIRISRRVRAALILAALVIVLLVVWRVPSALTTTIGGFALVLSFPVRFLSRFVPRGLAILLSFLLAVGLLALAALFLVPLIVEQFTALVRAIPSIASDVERYLTSTLAFLRERNLLRADPDELTSRAGNTLTDAARAVAGGVLGGAVGVVSGTLSFVLTLFGIVFIGAYLLIDVRKIKAAYLLAAPSGYRRDARDLWDGFGHSLSLFGRTRPDPRRTGRDFGRRAVLDRGAVPAGAGRVGLPYGRDTLSRRLARRGSGDTSWRSPSCRRP